MSAPFFCHRSCRAYLNSGQRSQMRFRTTARRSFTSPPPRMAWMAPSRRTRLPAPGVARLSGKLPAAGIIRMVWNSDVVFLAAAPFVLTGGVMVMLPPGSFLQAVEACERDMAACGPRAGRRRSAEQARSAISSQGSAPSPSQRRRLAPVTAYEENAKRGGRAFRGAGGRTGLKARFRGPARPLSQSAGTAGAETFAAAVLDPPREGAEAQARALASSKIATVIMLSCNPVSFARDAAILTAAASGWRGWPPSTSSGSRRMSRLQLCSSARRPKGRTRSPALKR